jgi:hypothetical protein
MPKPSSFYHMHTFKITHHGNIWSLASMLHTKGQSHFLPDDPVKNAIHSNYTVKKAPFIWTVVLEMSFIPSVIF